MQKQRMKLKWFDWWLLLPLILFTLPFVLIALAIAVVFFIIYLILLGYEKIKEFIEDLDGSFS